MSVPKKRRSKQAVRSNHAGKGKVLAKKLTTCSNCSQQKAPHKVCTSCGQYKGRLSVNVERRQKRLERKQHQAK